MSDGGDAVVVPVPGDCRVYRLIKEEWIKPPEFGDADRPTSEAFSDSSEDGYMSVFLEDEMRAEGLDPGDLLKRFPEYKYCCWWTVSKLVELGQSISRQPIDDFPGHAGVSDVTGRRSTKRRRKLAIAATWHSPPGEVD